VTSPVMERPWSPPGANCFVLFRGMAIHSFVPNDFGVGLIVPLAKDKTVDNYRGITLTVVISKLFELVLTSNCEDKLCSDELHLGFKL
jgi:hypothetical protein